MPTTWDELVASVTARYPLRCRQTRHLCVPVGSGEPPPTREWVLVPVSQSDEWERLVEQAIG